MTLASIPGVTGNWLKERNHHPASQLPDSISLLLTPLSESVVPRGKVNVPSIPPCFVGPPHTLPLKLFLFNITFHSPQRFFGIFMDLFQKLLHAGLLLNSLPSLPSQAVC